MIEYVARGFEGVKGLTGLPEPLLEAHLKLYAGYVRNLNLLRGRLAGTKPGSPEFSELHRRVGFEINGMRLHELYFENLSPGGGAPGAGALAVLGKDWGSFDAWRADFTALGALRGVGWVILYRDPVGGALSNHWIGLHEEGHPAGFRPLLVMDVWEHAFSGMERANYVEAFLANASWEAVETRLTSESSGARP